MADQQQHAARWQHHRQPRQIQDPWREEGVVQNDRDEARSAARYDRGDTDPRVPSWDEAQADAAYFGELD